MTLFGKNNKPLMKKGTFTTQLGCCPDPSPCCSDSTPGNDPTPPTNCGWNLIVSDETGLIDVIAAPGRTSVTYDGGQIVEDAVVVIDFEAEAIVSPVAAITVLTSGAAGLDGGSTYVGATPAIPVGNTSTVGTLTLDTTTVGVFSVVVTIETDCSTVEVTIDYEVITVP